MTRLPLPRPGQGQPVPVRRPRRAPTATTRSCRSCSRSRSPTSSSSSPPTATPTRSSAPASRARTSPPRALAALPRRDRLGRPAGAHHDRQARAGRRAAWAAARPTPRPRCGSPPPRPARRPTRPARGSRSALGADVPSQLAPERCLMTGIGEGVRRLGDPAPFGLLIVPSAHALSTPGGLRRVRPARPRPRPRRARPPERPGPGRRARRLAARRAAAAQRPARRPPARSARRSATRSPTCARPAPCARWSPAPARPCSGCSPARTGAAHAQAAAAALRARHPDAVAADAGRPRVRRAAGGLSVHPAWLAGAVALALYLVVRRRAHGRAVARASARSPRPARC